MEDKTRVPVRSEYDNRKDLPNASASGSFISNGEWWQCTTRPRSDLSCLQLWDADTVEWEYLSSSVPIFDVFPGFYVGHIALDYDPKWSDELYCNSWSIKGPLGCAIKAATDQTEWAENLWFIDFRIR